MSNRNQLPICTLYQELINKFSDKTYVEQIENDDSKSNILTTRQEETMEYQWGIISDFVNDIPNCYDSKIRSKFINEKSKENGCTRMQIQRILHKFWANGMTKDALIPEYPSSTTLLVITVMPTLVEQVLRRMKKNALSKIIMIVSIAFSFFMVVGRLISGVHWLTDIIGSVFLSIGLFYIYKGSILICLGKKTE